MMWFVYSEYADHVWYYSSCGYNPLFAKLCAKLCKKKVWCLKMIRTSHNRERERERERERI